MTPLIDARNVTIHVGKKILCRNLELQIYPGDCLGILGPNGSGKTTLLLSLANLHPVSAGDICLFHQKIASVRVKEIAKSVGILFQLSEQPFTQSVYEFCLAGRHPHGSLLQRDSAYDQLITTQALTTMGLAHQHAQKINTLSGGERQRLSIATLLTQNPRMYLLDEVLNHLDIYHQIQVLNHFKILATTQGVGVALSLHDINMAKHYCNRILMLFGNGETLQGHPQEILTPSNFKRLYNQNFRGLTDHAGQYWLPEF